MTADSTFVLTADNAQNYAFEQGLINRDMPSKVEELAGGVSCTTLRILPESGDAIVLKQALRQLKVAAEWNCDPARAEHEVLLLRLAHKVIGPDHVPEVLHEDQAHHIVAMKSAPLDARNWKTMLLSGDIHMQHGAECGRILACLHNISPTDSSIPAQLHDQSFFRQLRIEPYLEHVAGLESDVAEPLHELCDVLMKSKEVISHADYTPKNFLVSGEQLILLDYEVAHIGHPAFDVASILNHLFLKAVQFTQFGELLFLTSQEFLSEYLKLKNQFVDTGWIFRCLGGLMLARVKGKSPVEYLCQTSKEIVVSTGRACLRDQISSLEGVYTFAQDSRRNLTSQP